MKTMLGSVLLLTLLAGAAMARAVPSRSAEQRVAIQVTGQGFVPATVKVKAGRPVVLVVTRTTDKTCAKEIVIGERKIHERLPLNRAVEIRFTPRKAGTLRYSCGMDMIAGKVVVE
jgi:plastocyanin domain-containing protein